MNHKLLLSQVSIMKGIWKNIIKSKIYTEKMEFYLYTKYDEIQEVYGGIVSPYFDNSFLYESMIDYLIYLNKPKEEITWMRIGFINEFFSWECESYSEISSRIEDNKIYSDEYEKQIPLILKIFLQYTNLSYEQNCKNIHLYPFKLLKFYQIIGDEFLKCDGSKAKEAELRRHKKMLKQMKEFIEKVLNKDLYNAYKEIEKSKQGDAQNEISIDEIEELIKNEYTQQFVKKSRNEKNTINGIKSKWNEILEIIENVKIDGIDTPAEEILQYRLLDRLISYLDKNEVLSKHQKDIISSIITVYDIDELVYTDPDGLKKCVESFDFKEEYDLQIFIGLDKVLNESGENTNYCQKYIDFFTYISEAFIGNKNTTKKEKLKKYLEIFNHNIEEKTTSSQSSFDDKSDIHSENETEDETEDTTIKSSCNKSIEELVDELNSLIGLKSVKSEVTALINLIKIRKMRESMNLKQVPMSLHLVFSGNPGTGKTTVARLLAQIYCRLGLLSKGQLTEVDRSGLVAGYVGQTALKVKKVIEKSLGGILFIDEAYSLTLNRDDNDFGYEAIDTLLKGMEDNRNDLIVIVAGYPEPMNDFLESNPGLKSRFNRFILFEDYTPQELMSIFDYFCKKNEFIPSNDLKTRLNDYLNDMYANRDNNFSNGRFIRNIFEKIIVNQANRLATQANINADMLKRLEASDLKM